MDRDKFTFILREIAGQPEQRCSFDAGQFENVMDAFTDERPVRVAGELEGNTLSVVALRVRAQRAEDAETE